VAAGGKSGEATFRVNIDGNASVASKDIAASARQAAKAIGTYENEVKTLSADLRRLSGNSDEVNAAKAALKKRIDEAKQSVSKLTTELTKQGTSYTAAAAAAKKYSDGVLPNLRGATKRAAAAVSGAAGNALGAGSKKLGAALAPLKARVGKAIAPLGKKISETFGPAGKKLAKFGSGAKEALTTVAKAAKEDAGTVLPGLGNALGLVAEGSAIAVAAIAAVGVAAGAAGLAVIGFGLHAADAAAKMQRQREALLGNAKDAKNLGDQIDVLAKKVPQGVGELNKLGLELSKTRLSGKAIVSTMNAVAQATGAVDESAGAKIKELITRGQATGRFFLGQLELQGTGIDFDDVAKEYAAGTKKSLAAARKELMTGKVPLEAAADVLARVTEKKFGKLNLANAFSLENAPTKFFDQLASLAKGIDLGPIAKGLQDAFGQLAPNAPLGAAIKQLFETVGPGLVDIAARSIPVLVEGLTWLVDGAVRVATAYYELKKDIQDALNADDWVALGKAIVQGLVKGILGAFSFHNEALFGMGKMIKKAFTDDLQIHSPSRVFAEYGRNTVEGYAQGVERSSSRAESAVSNMVPAPSASSGGRGGPISVEVNIHGAPTDNAEAMSSPQFLAQLTHAIRDALTMQGGAAA
jgi:hypothetical protein